MTRVGDELLAGGAQRDAPRGRNARRRRPRHAPADALARKPSAARGRCPLSRAVAGRRPHAASLCAPGSARRRCTKPTTRDLSRPSTEPRGFDARGAMISTRRPFEGDQREEPRCAMLGGGARHRRCCRAALGGERSMRRVRRVAASRRCAVARRRRRSRHAPRRASRPDAHRERPRCARSCGRLDPCRLADRAPVARRGARRSMARTRVAPAARDGAPPRACAGEQRLRGARRRRVTDAAAQLRWPRRVRGGRRSAGACTHARRRRRNAHGEVAGGRGRAPGRGGARARAPPRRRRRRRMADLGLS